MPAPLSGKAGSAVPPAQPRKAFEADAADPGAVAQVKAAQRETKEGKYGSVPSNPSRPPASEEEKQERNTWVEFELVDKKGNPVPGEPYSVTLPDGTTETGTLDEKGLVRIAGIKPGQCKITFPKLDKKTWTKK